MNPGSINDSRLILAAGLALTLVIASITTAPGSVAEPAEGPANGDGAIDRFNWSAPADLAGTFVAILRGDVTTDTFCRVKVLAVGRFIDEDPVAFWTTFTSDDRGSAGGGHIWQPVAQAHVGSIIDSRALMEADGHWGASGQSGGTVEETFEVMVLAFGLDPAEAQDLESPLSIEVTCDHPFAITGLHAGRAGRSFTQDSLGGGVGATVNAVPGASASVGDGLEASFDEARVRFVAVTRFAEVRHGELTLEHPEGTRSWTFGQFEPSDLLFDGGPGDYRLDLTWATAARTDELFGFLVGVDPVESLDEVV